MINSSAEVTDLDLNDFAKFKRRVRFRAKLFKDLKSRLRKEYLGLLAQKGSKPISHKMKVGEIVLVETFNKKRLFTLEIQPEELPVAAVVMESVPEPSTLSEVPVAYTYEEVNPELIEVTPAMDICKFSRCGRNIKPPQKLDLLNLTVFFES
ncbi:hypothetical protein TNCT_260431 [Trichonephila clavata]|uniref:Uncharacterized protein n=1 Tax=Trichonephila clavata TaxID=2740835 RepID=A0A8X6I6H3_TRICU|nr:hypothetical protein TNCT_260431 [Trichonephila clavata]